jgi:hypothetical protein
MPGLSFDTLDATAIAGTSFNWIAIPFTVAVTEKLQSILVPLEYGTGPNTMTFSIYSGTTTHPTTTLLETLTVTNVPRSAPTMETLNSVTHPTLNPGTTYFLVQKQTSNSTAMNWYDNNIGQTGYYTTFNGSTWFDETGSFFTTPAYEINFQSSAPEPATFLCVIPPAGLVLIRRRFIQKSARYASALQ